MSPDISIALQLAEHFRQENQRLLQQLNHALAAPPRFVMTFAGWKVEHITALTICTTTPAGVQCIWDDTHDLFPLLAAIADYQP